MLGDLHAKVHYGGALKQDKERSPAAHLEAVMHPR